MDDIDPIGLCIEARARDLFAALADALDGVPHWRFHGQRLVNEIEQAAKQAVIGVIEHEYPCCGNLHCVYWYDGQCTRDPACDDVEEIHNDGNIG